MITEKLENGNLLLKAEREDIVALEELLADTADSFDSDSVMYEALESFIANSEFEWIQPEQIGALTSAPILGITDEDGNVLEAYGFMDYQITSLQRELLDYGKAELQKG